MAEADNDANADLKAAAHRLRRWVTGSALPLWARNGFAPDRGGVQESLDRATGAPCGATERPRVPPRQIYSVLTGASLGWRGDADRIVQAVFDDYIARFRVSDGTFRANITDADERPFDLYDQAFALFGYAALAKAWSFRHAEMEAAAAQLRDRLKDRLGHPLGGFQEDSPARLPLRSNPHMHLFEAAQAWERISADPEWGRLADEIADLALTRFIDDQSGALREFFDADWRPMPGGPGRIVEPGHQFEWAWLLARWGASRENAAAHGAAHRLFEIGRDHGICPERHCAIMSLTDDFTVRDPVARLWSQTEWLKAAMLLSRMADNAHARAGYEAQALMAIAAMERFLDTEFPGTWYDKMDAGGNFIEEPAPASSFYHIICAIDELVSE